MPGEPETGYSSPNSRPDVTAVPPLSPSAWTFPDGLKSQSLDASRVNRSARRGGGTLGCPVRETAQATSNTPVQRPVLHGLGDVFG